MTRSAPAGCATRGLPCGALIALALAIVPAPAVRAGDPAAAPTPAGRSWLSVGRLDAGAGRFCTVSLIDQDRALTAAHCVVDAISGQALAPARLQVWLGLRNGRAEATRGVRQVRLAPASTGAATGIAAAATGAGAAMVAADLAVLELDSPVRLPQVPPIPPAPGPLSAGQQVSVISYARGRSEVAHVQTGCPVLMQRSDGVLVLDCVVDPGASGAPVVRMVGGQPRVVAVISARAELRRAGPGGVAVGLAAPLDGPAGRALLAPAAPIAAPDPVTGVRVRRQAGGVAGPGTPGARFVRP